MIGCCGAFGNVSAEEFEILFAAFALALWLVWLELVFFPLLVLVLGIAAFALVRRAKRQMDAR